MWIEGSRPRTGAGEREFGEAPDSKPWRGRSESAPGPQAGGGGGARVPGRRGLGALEPPDCGMGGGARARTVTRKWGPLLSSPLSIGSGRGITATTMASSSSSPSSHLSVTSKQSSAAPSAFRAMVRPVCVCAGEIAVTGRRRPGAQPGAASRPAPPPPRRPPLTARPATGASGPPRDRARRDPGRGGLNPGPQAPAAPFYGGSLSAPSRTARRGPAPDPARPIARGPAPGTRLR